MRSKKNWVEITSENVVVADAEEEMAVPVEVAAKTTEGIEKTNPPRPTCFIPMELGTKLRR